APAGFWYVDPVTGSAVTLTTHSVQLFGAAGLIGTIGGRLSRFFAVEKVGAPVSSAVGNLTPLIATVLAIAVLGERVTLPVILGTVVIVVGTVLLSVSGRRLGFRPWMIMLPLTSATCFGIVQVIRKVALAGMGPVMGAAVNLTTALIAFTALMIGMRH